MAYHLGVDLGTTFTAAAATTATEPVVVDLGNRAMQIPSVVYFFDDGNVLVGEAADSRSHTDPYRAVREFKRRLGDPVPILAGSRPVTAQSVSAHLLRWVVDHSTQRMGEAPIGIVLTYPANWGSFKFEFLREIAALADVGAVRACSEPVAAAVEYASHTKVAVGETIVVYDLGGGTFDVCVLMKNHRGFDLLGRADGIEQLGGVDFDEAIFRLVIDMLPQGSVTAEETDPPTLLALRRLRRDCVVAKEALSFDAEAVIPVALPGLHSSVTVTRAAVEDLIKPALTETVLATKRALRSADVAIGELAAVVLVGGSSRIPLVAATLSNALRCPIALDTHPKSVVALGAARAASIHGATDPLIVPKPRPELSTPTPLDAAEPSAHWEARAGHAQGSQPARTKTPPSPQTIGAFTPPQGRGHFRGAALITAAIVLVIGGGIALSMMWLGRGTSVQTGAGSEESTSIGSSVPTGSLPSGLLPMGPPLTDDQLVVDRMVDGNLDLYVVDVETGAVGARLTTDLAQERGPVLSPDRRTIIYGLQAEATTTSPRTLRVVDSSGAGDRRLFAEQPPECLRAYRPTWNPVRPDELAISCRDEKERHTLRIIRTNGEILADLDVGLPVVGDISWSPDGKNLAFYANETAASFGGTIYVMPVDGSAPPAGVYTAGQGTVEDPQWSPDGTQIVFSGSATITDPLDIFLMKADGTDVQRLTDHPGQDQDPSWSPDGGRLVFRSDRAEGQGVGQSKLWLMNVDGSNPRQVMPTDSAIVDSSTAWSRR